MFCNTNECDADRGCFKLFQKSGKIRNVLIFTTKCVVMICTAKFVVLRYPRHFDVCGKIKNLNKTRETRNFYEKLGKLRLGQKIRKM